ncbi:family 14 glycosylhydrolase [Aeromonas schubertii]|uniref:family 14 glycosylhydrolase n=1 Tax=Aeromonas schubertii TaxID=652 RepID=UPI0038B59320
MTRSPHPLHLWAHLGGDPHPRRVREDLPARLSLARSLGIEGVVVPILWRHLAPDTPRQMSEAAAWQPLLRLCHTIADSGLALIPEVHLAAAGSGYDRLLPDWLWGWAGERLPGSASADLLRYRDEAGVDSSLSISWWGESLIAPLMRQWLSLLTEQLSPLAAAIPHLQLGMGPAGEWRYPDFARLGWPLFGRAGLAALRRDMVARYGSPEDWQCAWQMPDVQEAGLRTLLSTPGEAIRQEVASWLARGIAHQGRGWLSQVEGLLQGPWQHTTLGARLAMGHTPVLAEPGAIDAWLDEALPDTLPVERLRIWLAGGEEEEALCAWQQTCAGRGMGTLIENRGFLPGDDHPCWERYRDAALRGGRCEGWVWRDLDRLEGVAERVRHLARLRHTKGQGEHQRRKEFRVMGPLHLKVGNQRHLLSELEWQRFEDEVAVLRRLGVTAISTDIWWGLVEGRQPGLFDWSYYDRLVELLERQQMRWVPILSFHQAGGNVNDDFTQTIPLWLWGALLARNPELGSVRELQYVSETGDASMEYLSLWADEWVLPYYRAFMEAFREHYQNRAALMAEINVSLGPAGELRYPSYNAHDWGNYPNRGTLQCYSELARADWCRHLARRYQDIRVLNYTFGTHHETFEAIPLPQADLLFENRAYQHSAWGREYLGWYHDALVSHGRRITDCALAVFDEPHWSRVPIGIKIPGIHWEIGDPHQPRVAEITAGLLRPHPTMGPHNQREYVQLLDALVPAEQRGRVVVHFTCLEMQNRPYEGYSQAADLVGWFAAAAHELGIRLMGENALAGELYGETGWRQMEKALAETPGFGGLTLLRMQHFFDEDRSPLEQLQRLITRFQ